MMLLFFEYLLTKKGMDENANFSSIPFLVSVWPPLFKRLQLCTFLRALGGHE